LLDRSEARGAVVIPENFQRDFYTGKTVEVQWVIEGTQLKNAGKVKSGAAGVTNYVMSQLRPPGGSAPIQPKVRFWFNPGKEGYNYYAPGSFVIGIALFTPLMAALAFSRERAKGATARAFTSDINPLEFVIGKIAAYSLVGLVQAALCFVFIIEVFQLEPVGELLTVSLRYGDLHDLQCNGWRAHRRPGCRRSISYRDGQNLRRCPDVCFLRPSLSADAHTLSVRVVAGYFTGYPLSLHCP
jgi:hypothetical protein